MTVKTYSGKLCFGSAEWRQMQIQARDSQCKYLNTILVFYYPRRHKLCW